MLLVVEPNINKIELTAIDKLNGHLSVHRMSQHNDSNFNWPQIKAQIDYLCEKKDINDISFRFIFGGRNLDQGAVIDNDFLKVFSQMSQDYPYYVPYMNSLLSAFLNDYKDIRLSAFFENSFFSDLPLEKKFYAIPSKYSKEAKEKNGFHGIYHQCNSSIFKKKRRVISVVLERHTTVCPVLNGKPLAISLGNSPLEGVMGLTSCGDVDPGIILYLMKEKGYSIFQLDNLLKRKSGFLGLTGYDLTLEELLPLYGSDQNVRLAFDVYENHILKYIGEGIALLGGVDAIFFGGENVKLLQPLIYQLVKRISFLGVNFKKFPWQLDKSLYRVSAIDSKIGIYLNLMTVAEIIYNSHYRRFP